MQPGRVTQELRRRFEQLQSQGKKTKAVKQFTINTIVILLYSCFTIFRAQEEARVSQPVF
jgi:hypothetical protein